jgi:lysine-specific demethylase 3
MTSIFARSWMCRLCGREACAECFKLVKELTDPGPTDVAEMAALQVRRERHSHTNPFFLACTRRNEHQAKDFSPMSRFCNTELTQVIKDMEALLHEPDPDALPAVDTIDLNAHGSVTENGTSPSTSSSATLLELTSPNGSTTESAGVDAPPAATSTSSKQLDLPQDPTSVSLNPRESMEEVPSFPTKRFTDAELTDDVFRPIWARGEPLVVTGLLDKFRIKWTPEYFIAKYSSQSCLVIECQTDANKRVTVGEFFSLFGKYENRTECWKLKVMWSLVL